MRTRTGKSSSGALVTGTGVVIVVAAIAMLTTACSPGDPAMESDGAALSGDGLPSLTMGEPDAVWPAAFSVLSTVRELPDGRVLVADPLGQVLMRLDLDAGVADTIGGVGEGPAEYRQPDAVWPLPGGRTLLVDLGNGRLTELDSTLAFGDTRPYSIGDLGLQEIVLALPQAVDERGGLYFRGFGRPGERDSAEVLRYDFESEALDTVAMVKVPDVVVRTSGGPGEQNQSISQVPLSPADAWGVAPDGRVVVARVGDYHVDWIALDGSITHGPAMPHAPVNLGRAEREQWAHERLEQGGGMSFAVLNNNGVVTMTATRGGPPGEDNSDLDNRPWPEVKPPFYSVPLPVDPMGRAWVRRHRAAGEAPAYDLFDSYGEAVMTIEFGMGRRVIGFGSGVLYAIHMDEFGLQVLERYALPE